jgi:two-component system response regulator PilR (NtrC family)
MNLPDGNGIELVAWLQERYPATPVAMITAYGSVETAISALKAGAFDFISKPVNLGQLRDLVKTALKLSDTSTSGSGDSSRNDELLGTSPEITYLNEQITKLARSQAPVYISGESGSGKERVARLIHQRGPRANGPFIAVNCGAIPSELMESEFFGHRKGSFSGAINDKSGLFRAADGGTLFLDEVADLPLAMQVKLLRAIQEKSVRPVGAQNEEPVDIRVLSATHKDLAELVERGEFRQDLFYRINVIRLDVPALRERQDDIGLLAQRFLAELAGNLGISDASLSNDALAALRNYSFPGNVRELQNIIERAFTLCEQNTIRAADLQLEQKPLEPRTQGRVETSTQVQPHTMAQVSPPAATSSADHARWCRPQEQSLESFLEQIERAEIEAALLKTKWNRTAAAKELGISFRALRYRLKKLGMD